MHRDWNIKLPLWEGDFFGRLTPPPEDEIEMERGFLNFKPDALEEQNTDEMECESSLLDLEFESICPGEFDGYKSGPTLAELNETRSRSPLINPEMKRLHQAAILTVGEVSEKSCRSTLVQSRSHSVLEQQLRTQPSTSICHDQFVPSRNNCTTQLSSTVNRSEPIRVPGRDVRTPQALQKITALSPPWQERKVFVDSYNTQGVSPQLVSQPFRNNHSAPKGEYCMISPSSSAITVPSLLCSLRQQRDSVPDEQVSESLPDTTDETTTEQYDASDDDDFESDDDMDDAEEYCPFEKEGKTPRRKGRKSESEDMVPNPTKLLSIGRELDRLNKIISDLKPINELPQHSRGRSRKEKNKLASRACRLKKKQQHEANKVKLHGLENEQENLTVIINDMKKEIVSWAILPQKPPNPLNEKFKDMAKKALSQQIAGHTTEFVRKVLQEVAKGKQSGGLHISTQT